MTDDFVLEATLDDSQIEQAFKNIETKGARAFKGLEKDLSKVGVKLDEVNNRFRRIDNSRFVATSEVVRRLSGDLSNVATQANNASTKINNNANNAGKSLGVLTGVTTALTSKMIELGQTAVNTFARIIKGSVDSAIALEVVETSLTGILEGNEDVAIASLRRIREESIRIGVDLEELAPAFLPKVETLDQFVEIGKLVASLATLDPAQGRAGARLAITEALAGDTLSLRRRFEIDVDPINDAQDELGDLDGLLVGLGDVLEARGQDFENLSTTAQFTFNQTKTFAEDVQKTLGEPILDELKEDFQVLNAFLIENKDSIDIIAGSLGDLIGDLADLSGDQLLNFAEGLDPTQIQEFILQLQDLVAIVDTFIEFSDDRPLNNLFEGTEEATDGLVNVKDVTVALIQVLALLDAVTVATLGSMRGYADIASRLISGELDISNVGDAVTQLGDALANDMNTVLDEANQKIDNLNGRLEENRDRLTERTEAVHADTSAGEEQADSILTQARAEEELAQQQEEAEEAQNKLNEARDKFDTEKERAKFDLQLKQERELIDLQIANAQKREDIARKNAQAIEDIGRRNSQRIVDARTALSRKEEDIARKGARQRIDLEREIAKQNIEIETDFRRELERIRAKFDFDAQEAIRQNDAIAFLRVQRQKDFEIQQASSQRDEDKEDAQSSAIDQRNQLNEQLQLQVEDARIANERKLEDLRISLARELAEQELKTQREIQAQVIAEQRKREEIAKSQKQQQEDFNRAWERRLADLQKQYARELQITRENEARLREARASSRDRGRDRSRRNRGGKGDDDGGVASDSTDPTVGVPKGKGEDKEKEPSLARRFGGYTPGGIDVLVGENGAEVIRLPQSGNVIPNNQLQFNPATSNITNIQNNLSNLNLEGMSNNLSPQQLAIVTQLFNQLQLSVFQ